VARVCRIGGGEKQPTKMRKGRQERMIPLLGLRVGPRSSVSVSFSIFFLFFANPAVLIYCMKSAGIQPKSDRKLMFGSVPHNTIFDELNNRRTGTSPKKEKKKQMVHTT